MNILAIGLLFLRVQLAAADGMVAKPGGSEPLPKATVLLSPVAAGQNARLRSAVTEEDGRFTLRDIEPGEYRLTVQHDRFGQAAYGQLQPNGPGSILSFTAGQQLTDLRLSMIPTGAIAGRITGRSGEPLVYAVVQAFKYGYENGRKILITAQSTTTNDRGEYRLFWLPAGQYYVAASAGSAPVNPAPRSPVRPGMTSLAAAEVIGQAELFSFTLAMQSALRGELHPSGTTRLRILDDGTTQEEAWAPVYYPATTEARLATALDVAAGTTRNGIDIVLGPARIQSVRGRIFGFTPGSTPTVTIVPQDASVPRTSLAGRGASNIDGSFVFTGVLPGDYVVLARDLKAGVLGPPLPIHVGDSDVENLTVGMGQAVSIGGQILIDGAVADAGGQGPLQGIIVALRPSNLPIPALAPINAQPDPRTGSFVLNNLAPGDYQMQVIGGARAPLYVKSARLGLTDATGGIRIAANATERLEIVLTPDAGSVEGVAIGSRGGPAANTTVVLVPNVARQRSDLYRSVVTGTDGRFRFQNLNPGDYKLFAWDDVETGAWQDPDFIRAYETKGLLVHLGEKSKEDVQLTVIYTP